MRYMSYSFFPCAPHASIQTYKNTLRNAGCEKTSVDMRKAGAFHLAYFDSSSMFFSASSSACRATTRSSAFFS